MTGAVTLNVQYDFIVKPPGMGGVRHPRTGAYRPEPFMKVLHCIAAYRYLLIQGMQNRINGQYIIEGLSSGGGDMCNVW